VPAAAKKSPLVCALSACVSDEQKRHIKRFLQGLATDELQYIAEFLGSCILESGGPCYSSRTQLAGAVKQFEISRRQTALAARSCRGQNSLHSLKSLKGQDQEHKMILLLEYLCRSGLTHYSIGVGAGQG